MPNWKKVITSGSDARLNAITMSGNIIPDEDNVHSLGTSANRFQLNGGTPVTVTGSGTTDILTRFNGATEVENSTITNSDTLTTVRHTNDGNQIFIVSGSNGELLSVTDEVGDELLRVNDTSGIGVFIVSSSGTLNAERLTASTQDFVLTYDSASGDIFFQSASIIRNESGILSQSAQIADDISGSLSATAIADLGARIVSGTATQVRSFLNVENGATADQTGTEIATALNNEDVDLGTGNITASNIQVGTQIVHTGDSDTYINFENNLVDIYTAGIRMATFGGVATVFNEASNDRDFRVESNNNQYMLYVDGGNDRVGIGTSDPQAPLEVQTANTVIAEFNGTGANGGYTQFRSGSTIIGYEGSDYHLISGTPTTQYYTIRGENGLKFAYLSTEYARVDANGISISEYLRHTGDTNTYLRFLDDKIQIDAGGIQMITITEGATDSIVFNEDSNDVDFRVESNGNANMLFVDGGNDKVGIGTGQPAQDFVVADATNGNGIEFDAASTSTIQAYNRGSSTYLPLNLDTNGARIRSAGNTIFYNGSGFTTETLRIDEAGVSGSVPFSGSFVGDGSGLTGLTSANDATITLTPGAGIGTLGNFTTNQSSNETITIGVDGVLQDLDTLGAPTTDGQFIVATGAGAFAYESGATVRTSLGLGTAALSASTDFVAVTGDGMTGNLLFNDSVEVRIGTGADTKIYHNGTNTYIDNYTNDLYIQNQANDKDILFLSDDGSGGLATYFRLDGSLGYSVASKHILFDDNTRARFGNSGDLEIQHDSANSTIINNTGHLILRNIADDSDIVFDSDDGSGGVTEYFRVDGSSNIVYFTKNPRLADDTQLQIGDGADLRLYHNGSHSFVQNNEGSLYIRSNHSIQLEDTSGNDMLVATDGGAIELYHNANQKLATTSGGVDITGDLDVSGTVTATKIVTNVVSQSILLTTGSNIFGDELIDTHEFTGSVDITGSLTVDKTVTTEWIDVGQYIRHKGDTNTYLDFYTDDGFRVVTDGVERLRFNANGAIFNEQSSDQDFRVESNNNANMLFVDGGTDRVGIGTSSPGTTFDVIEEGEAISGTSFYYNGRFKDTDNTGVLLGHNSTANGVGMIAGINELAFLTYDSSWGERMRIDGSGNVGIGTDSPNSILELSGTNPVLNFKDTGGATDQKYFYLQGSGDKFYISSANDDYDTFATHVTVDRNSNVGIGTTDPQAKLHVVGQISGSTLDIAGAAEVEYLDVDTSIRHKGDTDTYINFPSDNNIDIYAAGELMLGIDSGNVVVNEAGGNNDFRVESNNNANMLFVDGGTDRVGIGTNTPGAELDVRGKVRLEGDSEHQLYHTGSSLIKNSGRDTTLLTGRDLDLYAYDDVNIRAGSSDKITFTAAGTSDILVLDTNGIVMGSLSNQASEATALVINGSNVVGTRELGGGAFLDTAAISDGGTGLATADQIHTFVTGLGYTSNTGTVDTSGTPAANDFAKFTDANTVEGRSYSEVKSDLSLNNVTNESKATMFTSPTFTGTPTISSTAPVLKLTDTNATNTTDLAAYISLQVNGVENGWMGYGSNSNSDLTVKNSSGYVRLDGSLGTYIDGYAYVENGIIHAGDSNNKIDFGTDTQTFVTAGTTRLTIGSTGTVTFNTGDVRIGEYLYHDGDTDTYLRFENNLITLAAAGASMVEITSTDMVINQGSNDRDFRVESNGDTHMLFVDGGNNRVGIGTSSPGYTLDVDGSLHSTTFTLADAIYHEGDTNNYIQFGTDTQNFYTGGTLRAQISNAGLALNNHNITGINHIEIADPGPTEGISWNGGNFKIVESPDDLTTNTKGNLQIVSGSTRVATFGAEGETALYVEGSGSTVFEVQGSEGQLFSVTDDLSGDIFTVSDISGIPIFTVNADGSGSLDGQFTVEGHLSSSTADFTSQIQIDDHVIKDSSDRTGLLEIDNNASAGTWSGIQVTNDSGQLWSFMGNNVDAGLYDDTQGEWALLYNINGSVELYHNGSKKIETTSGGVAVTGAITATGDITAYYSSDKRLKENIKPIENATDKVKKIGGYEFDWKKNDDPEMIHEGHDIGVIAQEVEEVLPEIVTDRENGYKAVEYHKLIALLIESNKELAARVEELENKLK